MSILNDLKEVKEFNGGHQLVYEFPNGLGASIIRHKNSYGFSKGLWEMAPMDEKKEFIGRSLMDWDDDVKGYLDEGELVYYLEKIRCLPTPI